MSVPDPVYRRARVRAAERDTSVSALVRAYLESLASEESDFERRRRLQPTTSPLRGGLETRRRHRLSYWDAAVLAAARALGCEVLLSEDLAHGRDYDGVRVVDPFR